MATVEMFVLHLAAESVFEQKSVDCYILVTAEIMLCFLTVNFSHTEMHFVCHTTMQQHLIEQHNQSLQRLNIYLQANSEI